MPENKTRGKKYRGLYQRGGIWYVHFKLDKKSYRYSTGIQVSGHPSPDIQALVPRGREQKETAVKRLAGQKASAAEGPTRLIEYADEYLERVPEPRDIKTRTILIRHLTNFFPKGTELAHVNVSAALRYHQHQGKLFEKGIIKGRTANMRIAYAHTMFAQAIQDQRLELGNPFYGFDKFPENQRELVLDRLDEPILLDCCPPWLRAMLEDNLFLGLRAGEMRGLLKSDFRPSEGAFGYVTLDLTQTKAYRLAVSRGRDPGAKVGRIALTPEVRDRMRSRITSIHHEFFYSGPLRGPVRKDTMEKAIQRVWAKAEPEIAKRRDIPLADFRAEVKAKGGFVFHTLRHSAATRAGEAGLSEQELMLKFRMSPGMVKRYVHGSDEWSERAARKIAEAEG